ncbi:MAG: ATP-binding protein [Bacteroidota bacterium]|nr:ATP-binding protein [Bacteroidota bacterium]MDP3143927.1 ATP-binding protein [Bacteroidota bacterium]MDP3557575.1 ATP-binding protein [Bacteroidota bacterium]
MIPARNETLKINSKPDNLRLVERLIDDVCQIFNVHEDSYGNILIAVTEAVNNAIHHGNKDNPDKFVNIGFENSEKQLIFSVTDEGQGFDYLGLPDPTDPSNIGKISGRGVFLMKNLADSIEFEQNGQTVKLAFNS